MAKDAAFPDLLHAGTGGGRRNRAFANSAPAGKPRPSSPATNSTTPTNNTARLSASCPVPASIWQIVDLSLACSSWRTSDALRDRHRCANHARLLRRRTRSRHLLLGAPQVRNPEVGVDLFGPGQLGRTYRLGSFFGFMFA
ncbi:hypothetical protein Strop_3991 [Salinispora tropica CNB-440]|uniref:Uncharacterized protein n=1 Tax=Salinispora tropica (strain ATCC BAA-916 / DSM 44818 / JCM 13857 / NBRC 105044 / CNB-440) TaxID=369723 RepID=A4XBW4_SALTO|nr:hypothetical protein Strop_3991 [Salinispora tropica CNB-440]